MARCARLAPDSPWRIRNVQVSIYITTVVLIIWSFSFGATFDAYLLELAKTWTSNADHANEFVGSIESVRGMVALVLALPLGIIADKVNRRRMLQWNGLCGTLGVSLLSAGIAYDNVSLLYSGVVVAAVFMQVWQSAGIALLSDSVPKDQLTMVIAMQSTVFLIGYSVGPLAQMGLIAVVGDVWSIHQLHIFLLTGFAIWPLVLPAFPMFQRTRTELNNLQENLTAGDNATAAVPATAAVAAGAATRNDAWQEQRVLGMKKKWVVPLLIELCSLITAMGAGMTVKFFPLFFKEDYHFEPTALCGLSAAYTLSIAVFVQICRKLSQKVGRCRAALMWHVLGVITLLVLCRVESLSFVIFFYIIRGAFMNAKGPIDQAIVMDCVDSKYRGRWSAIQSISRFSWSGSAILGGLLADSHDYRYTFFITAIVYTISAVLYTPLLFWVPEQARPAAAAAMPAEGTTGAAPSKGLSSVATGKQAAPEGSDAAQEANVEMASEAGLGG